MSSRLVALAVTELFVNFLFSSFDLIGMFIVMIVSANSHGTVLGFLIF